MCFFPQRCNSTHMAHDGAVGACMYVRAHTHTHTHTHTLLPSAPPILHTLPACSSHSQGYSCTQESDQNDTLLWHQSGLSTRFWRGHCNFSTSWTESQQNSPDQRIIAWFNSCRTSRYGGGHFTVPQVTVNSTSWTKSRQHCPDQRIILVWHRGRHISQGHGAPWMYNKTTKTIHFSRETLHVCQQAASSRWRRCDGSWTVIFCLHFALAIQNKRSTSKKETITIDSKHNRI